MERAASERLARAAELEDQLLTAKGWGRWVRSTPPSAAGHSTGSSFESQLVCPTFAATRFLGDDRELAMGGTRALNRAMNAFCAHDRLWATLEERRVPFLIHVGGGGRTFEPAFHDLFLFSSDYPHPEGTKDPIQQFEETMDGVPHRARELFYSGNHAAMTGLGPNG